MPASTALESAARCRECANAELQRAANANSPEQRAAFPELAARWEALAKTYDSVAKMNLALDRRAA